MIHISQKENARTGKDPYKLKYGACERKNSYRKRYVMLFLS